MNDLQISELCFQQRGPYTLTIKAGTIAGLSGESGAGKSLLLRAIADLDPHVGTVQLGSKACEQISAPDWRKRVGLLPAESFWWYDTVGEHFKLSVQKLSSALQQLGFEQDVMHWQVSRLSTGEKQRLAIVRLLQLRPEALLLDEPTASLDSANIERTEAVLIAYGREHKAPLLWVSHDNDQLERVADCRYCLDSTGLTQQKGGHDGC
jgi:ABC-type iron transport system FetAB ATPase subunit